MSLSKKTLSCYREINEINIEFILPLEGNYRRTLKECIKAVVGISITEPALQKCS